jgi:hypothetical protein
LPVARLLGRFQAGTGLLLQLVVAPLRTHERAQAQAGHPSVPAGDVLGADRGLGSDAHLARLVQAGVPAVRRGGARQSVEFTPGRPFVRPRVRRTPAVNGSPRSRWLTARGLHGRPVAWLTPQACPAWLPREASAALPDSVGRREGRDDSGTRGFRTRQITRVTTRLDAALSRVADLAARVPPALAGRNLAGAPQDHAAAGGVARPHGARWPEGTARLRPGRQPRAPGHVALRQAPTPRRGAHQLPGGPAMAQRAKPGQAGRGVDRQPCPPRSGGAARQEAAAHEFPVHGYTPASTASAVGPANAHRLTSCHSALPPF